MKNSDNKNKKQGFFSKQLNPYRAMWFYKSSTKEMIREANIYTPKKLAELARSNKRPSHTFEDAMQMEGLDEEKLKKAHLYLSITMWITIIFMVVLFAQFVVSLFSVGFLTLNTLTYFCPLVIVSILHYSNSFKAFRIRNRFLALNRDFIKILSKRPFELMPVFTYDENIEKEYGENWKEKFGIKL